MNKQLQFLVQGKAQNNRRFHARQNDRKYIEYEEIFNKMSEIRYGNYKKVQRKYENKRENGEKVNPNSNVGPSDRDIFIFVCIMNVSYNS